jgi:hypothetical protein
MPIEQRLYFRRNRRIAGTFTGFTFPMRNRRRACSREHNRQRKSESQLSIQFDPYGIPVRNAIFNNDIALVVPVADDDEMRMRLGHAGHHRLAARVYDGCPGRNHNF